MANPTVADYLLHRLRAWGVDHVFGYPGDGINGILAAWTRTGNDPVFVQSRHEEMSAFEAVGYAKFTGRPGVCMATSGPGAIHLLNGLYDAKLDHVPVVAIVGQTDRSAMGGRLRPSPDHTGRRRDPAGRGDPQRRGQGGDARRQRRPRCADATRAGRGSARRRGGESPAGQGRAVGRVAVVTGSIGLLGTRPTHEMMTGCDTLLIVGSSLPYSQFLPEYGQARCVQIDIDPNMIGMRYPNEVNLVADAAAALDALVPLLQRKEDRSWREGIEQNVQRWWQTMGQQAEVETEFVNPLRMFAEASPRLPDDAIVTADSGSAANWYARQLQFRGDMRGSLSGTLATMGPAVPYGIGAKFAHPGRPVVAFAGDGAMQMNGMAELITIQRYWQQWTDPRLVVAIIHNNDLNQVTWEMRAMGGAPKFAESQSLPDVDYAAFARSLGLGGETVKSSDEMGSAWDRALAADRPTVLDVYTDPDMPPIPPHATWEQFTDVAKAVLAGDENRWGFVKQGVKTKLQEYLPGNDR
ncbi:Thiamine pyrophosphate enzyme, central domain [Rhodococcus pyridinivorans]|nr:Thiamine pyrophosphate enzyme, central domain [Rhodococcus pyridinivorans]